MENMKLQLFLDTVKTDIRDFKNLINNEEVTKKDILVFLDSLETNLKELEEE